MYEINEIKNSILNGDCKEILKDIPDNSIDLVVTSPPYDDLRKYNGYKFDDDDFHKIVNELYRVLKDGGVVVWVVGDSTNNGNKSLTSFRQAIYFQDTGFNVYDVMIYEKLGGGPPHKNRYRNCFEYMFVFSKGKPKTTNIIKDRPNKWAGTSSYSDVRRYRGKDGLKEEIKRKPIRQFSERTNIWQYNAGYTHSTKDEYAFKHPAIFPEKLAKDHIESWSNKGDIVLDIFGGSGTVGKMAKDLKRDYILIEISKEYCDIANRRVNEVVETLF